MVPSGKMPDPVDQKNEPAAPEAGKGPVTLDEMEQMLDELAERGRRASFADRAASARAGRALYARLLFLRR